MKSPLRHKLAVLACITCWTLPLKLSAQVPQLINHQGRVAVNGVNFDGTGQFKFALVNADGSTSYWSNDGTSTAGSQPSAAVSLTVTKGLYSVLLGANMTAIPNTVFNNGDVHLRVWFNDGSHGFEHLEPDQRIAAVGYAMMAGNVPDAAITSSKIANGAVGNSQLGAGAVQTENIASGAVGSLQIANGAVGAAQIANGSITATQLAKPPRSGSIETTSMQISFNEVRFIVPFVPAFAVPPAVTLAVRSSSPWQYPVWVESSGTDSFTGRFTVPPLEPSIPDSIGNVGEHTSLAVIDGFPAICYRDATYTDLKFVRATNANGTSWGQPVVVDGTQYATPFSSDCACGYGTSLALVNGNPAISYYDATSGSLKFVRALDASGTDWGEIMTLSYTGFGMDSEFATADTSLAVINGNPAICFYNSVNDDLMFIRSSDASGTFWDPPIIVDGTDSVGLFATMALINGNPAISYYDATNLDLKFVRASDASGTAWENPQTLDSTGSIGRYACLTVVNGNPAISYNDGTNGDLKFIRASDASGSAWQAAQTLDSEGSVGTYTSLAVIWGNPAISYRDFTNGDLKFVRATDATGIAWGTPITLDSIGSVGAFPSMTMVNGNPAISYLDVTNYDLKYITTTMPTDFSIQWIALEP
jgi:hypothetical protein